MNFFYIFKFLNNNTQKSQKYNKEEVCFPEDLIGCHITPEFTHVSISYRQGHYPINHNKTIKIRKSTLRHCYPLILGLIQFSQAVSIMSFVTKGSTLESHLAFYFPCLCVCLQYGIVLWSLTFKTLALLKTVQASYFVDCLFHQHCLLFPNDQMQVTNIYLAGISETVHCFLFVVYQVAHNFRVDPLLVIFTWT